jgi:hypothetical protein
VADVLGQLLREGEAPLDNSVRERLTAPTALPPPLACFAPELYDYDQLLEAGT